MAADKMRAGFGDERFQFAHDAGFHAANVGDNRAAFERRQHLHDARPHLRKRRAENDEIGVGNRREQVGRGIIHRAGLLAILQTRRAADEPGDFPRQPAASGGQPDGTAEQADADDGDFLKLHARKDSGWKMIVESLNGC